MPGTKKILEDAQLAKYRPVSVLQVLGDGGGRESYRPDAVRMYMVPCTCTFPWERGRKARKCSLKGDT